MKIKKTALAAAAAAAALTIGSTASAEAASTKISVYANEGHKTVSPYIYGVNSGVDMSKVTAGSFRLGGNRMSGYNWENNMSNAGADYRNLSDLYLVQNVGKELRRSPAGAALDAAKTCSENKVPYSLLTLPMLGYVSSDMGGSVDASYSAPSEYWCRVENRKGSELSLEPDKTDDVIYVDEYMNFLFDKIGNSQSETGFKGYALDNEPSLWSGTHSRVQKERLTCGELITKTVDLASLVKEMDSGAEVFGPSLFGYSAFDNFLNPPDWQLLRVDNNYRWFIDYYLDEMKKAEDESGTRLLDVLDIHYYTEQKGACGERSCNHYDNDECVQARLDSVRSLYEEGYVENSWIADTGAKFFPLLPNLQQSIDEYYPDTKLAFSEYNFGGGDHISGAVTEAETLGIFADYGVYFSTLWSFDQNEYQLSAINMFTDYDGKGHSFGDTLVKTEYENENLAVYSAVDSGDDDAVRIIAINKSLHENTPVSISAAADKSYEIAEVYELYGDSSEIRKGDTIENLTDNSFDFTLKPLSVTEFVMDMKPAETDSGKGSKTPLYILAGTGAGLAVVFGAAAASRKKGKKK